jgi:hypothetical protein
MEKLKRSSNCAGKKEEFFTVILYNRPKKYVSPTIKVPQAL